MITTGDIVETYFKIRQRGLQYILSKLSLNRFARVRNTFNEVEVSSSNYWIIPQVRERWNEMISGNPQEEYADYVVKKYLAGQQGLRMLSLGCGAGSHEVKFAVHANFSEIKGIDLAPKLINEANRKAKEKALHTLHYEAANLYGMELPADYYDVVLFHSSLHHFKHLDALLGQTIRNTLKKGGLLVMHEYVGPNRIRWTKEQLAATDQLLAMLEPEYRKRYRLPNIKTKAYRPGTLRMITSDPSEAVESETILSALHKHYRVLQETPLGGNLIMPLFKDIAHHFINGSPEVKQRLKLVFEQEDAFMRNHASDFVFGVYRRES